MQIQPMTTTLSLSKNRQLQHKNNNENIKLSALSFKAVKGLGNSGEILMKEIENFLYKSDDETRYLLKRFFTLHDEYRRGLAEGLNSDKNTIVAKLSVLYNEVTNFYYKVKADGIKLDNKIDAQMSTRVHKTPPVIGFGFSRISGYEDIKVILNKEFISKIKAEREGKTVDIPGVFAFFGPKGNGKSTSAQAIAEETGCKIEKIKWRRPINDEFMPYILEKAQNAQENFSKQGRTILLWDEFTNLLKNKNDYSAQFLKFLKECSEKYHCTFFGTTNRMRETGEEFMALNPVIVAFEAPSKYNTAQVLKHYLEVAADPKLNYSEAAEVILEHAKKNGVTLTNSDLKNISGCAKSQTNVVTLEDICSTAKQIINEECAKPEKGILLTPEKMKNYLEDYETYMK